MTRHSCCEALVGRRDVDRKAYVRTQAAGVRWGGQGQIPLGAGLEGILSM